MSTVLQVENINVYYGSIHAVKDVSFHVEQQRLHHVFAIRDIVGRIHTHNARLFNFYHE